MDIIVTRTIKKRELDGAVSEEARKLFAKLKDRPEIAAGISSPGLPARTTLHKVYATAEGGARRLLFFCRHAPASTPPATDRWVLLFYRDKADAVGKNMSPKNSEFTRQLAKNLQAALDDLAKSKPGDPHFELF
jgi:hypothetical protein